MMDSAKELLLKNGVELLDPQNTYIAGDVNITQFAAGTVIHPGCRISGAATSIGPECELGRESPLTLENCQLGAKVKLAGGYASGATFLNGAACGSGAHIRPGTIFEEQASAAHSVGLKQTILMPFVTLGSLINFCDIMMSGGTDRRNHGEVGSSYIHFNYAPQQHKATPSLIGDVPHGVMLNQPPVFLGGQGGLVGPTRIAFGTITAAGVICRRDITQSGKLLAGGSARRAQLIDYDPRLFSDIKRIINNNAVFFGNLLALREWYRVVRLPVMNDAAFQAACWRGAITRLDEALNERLRQIDKLAEAINRANLIQENSSNPSEIQRDFVEKWPVVRTALSEQVKAETFGIAPPAAIKDALKNASAAGDYITFIREMKDEPRKKGTEWLQTIVDKTAATFEIVNPRTG